MLTVTQVVPAEWVEHGGLAIGVDLTRPMLLEQSNHRRASRPAIQPISRPSISGCAPEGASDDHAHQRVNGAVSGLFRASKNQNHCKRLKLLIFRHRHNHI